MHHTGLLSAPLELNGDPQPNISAIHLTWIAPPSLDLTNIDHDITYYEIFVFDNKTGETENYTSFTTNYTYYNIMYDTQHVVDTCQMLEFAVYAVNVVGRGSESTISVGLHTGI